MSKVEKGVTMAKARKMVSMRLSERTIAQAKYAVDNSVYPTKTNFFEIAADNLYRTLLARERKEQNNG